MKILVTGAAGFVGFHLCSRLTGQGHQVVGLDAITDDYDPALKTARLKELGIDNDNQDGHVIPSSRFPDFHFIRMNLADPSRLNQVFSDHHFEIIIHLAGMPGVRQSLVQPEYCVQNNVVAFHHLLEACRRAPVRHLLFASSSSVYGAHAPVPSPESSRIDHPVSLYAATKRSCELFATVYSHLFRIPVTAMRFFTLYGPWGRPDMAYYSFSRKIMEGAPIELFNHGKMKRDFTYIDDAVESIIRLMNLTPEGKDGSTTPFSICNIGRSDPRDLGEMLALLESSLGKKAWRILAPLQPTEMVETCADISHLIAATGFRPGITLEDGISRFVRWFREYHPQ